MTTFLETIGAIVAGIFSIFILCIASTILGGISLWVVGGMFEYIPDIIREHTNTDYTNFQLGAMIGFFASTVRSMFYRGD